jgi:hypothetical protein
MSNSTSTLGGFLRPIDGDRRKATILILFGLWITWGFGWEVVGQRLSTSVNGVIVASRDVPSRGAPRYSTEYSIRADDGTEQVFWAGPTDASLPRSMPVGTHIRKDRWDLYYERDGRREDFPWIFYGLVLGLAVSMVLWGILILMSKKQKT